MVAAGRAQLLLVLPDGQQSLLIWQQALSALCRRR
jgi:hypothetical protein